MDNELFRRPRKKKPRYSSPAFLAPALLFAAIISGLWLWRGLYPDEPRFNFMLISVNQEPQKMLPGETISIHPTDKVKVLEVSTNILFNRNIRLESEGFDVKALQEQDLVISALLPNQDMFNHYQFKIQVMFEDRELGNTIWDIKPYAEDWLDKADKTIDPGEKIALLEQSLKLLPDDSRVQKKLIDEYISQKLWKKAAPMLEKAAQENPGQEILTKLLKVYNATSNKTKALSVMGDLLKLDPENLDLRLQFAEKLEGAGQKKSAIREYETLLKRVNNNKDKLSLNKRLGYLYSDAKEYKKAIDCYLTATKLDKNDSNLYYNLSYLYDKTNQKADATTYLEKAVTLNTKDVDSRLTLAQDAANKGDMKKAEAHLAQVLKEKPSLMKALLLKAQLLEKQGDKKQLVEIYKKILLQDQNNSTILYNIAALYYETGDYKSSLDYFNRYTNLNPNDVAAHEFVFDICRRLKDDKMAFNEAQTLVNLKSKRTDIYNFMFDYLSRQGNYNEIIRVMENGLKANPNQIELRKYLLSAYLKTGKEDLAIRQMEELLKVKPNDTGLMKNMARIHEKRGRYTKALELYKRIISISPGNEEAEEAYLRLRLKTVGRGGS
jgi:tetratricopeptide (TPR) repeat protein